MIKQFKIAGLRYITILWLYKYVISVHTLSHRSQLWPNIKHNFSHTFPKFLKNNYWLFQRVACDTSFGYFHVCEKFGIKRVNMLWYSTLETATPFSNDPLWLTLFVEGVNVRLLDHCQVSSLPHYCGFKEQEIPGIYTVGMVINWTQCKYSNILRYWFLTFMSCKL